MNNADALRDDDGKIAPAVRDAIDALTLQPEDDAAAALAVRYATTIDDAPADIAGTEVLKLLGPPLLSVLEALGATPRARSAPKKAGGGGDGPLAKLRAKEAERKAK